MTARRACWGLLLLLAVVIGPALPASAHAELVTSTPADGSVLQTSPADVRLQFTERVTVTLASVRVFDGAGDRVDLGNTRLAGSNDEVVAGLRADLPDGTYLVTWRVVSADSHPVHGGFLFSVGAPGSVQPGLDASDLDSSSDRGWQVAAAILRIAAYLTVLLAAGAMVMLDVIGSPDDERRAAPWLRSLAAVGASALVLGLPVQAALASGLGLGSITEQGVLEQVLGDGVGISIVAGTLGLLLVVVSAGLLRGATRRRLGYAGAALAAGSFAAAGHTRVSSPAWLASVADLSHLYAGALWFGGLAVLALVLRRLRSEGEPGDAAKAVARFSGLAAGSLGLVAISGATIGYLEVGSLRALTSTNYGKLLLLKVAVVGLVALAGAFNRFRLVPVVGSIAQDDERWQMLRRLVAAEVVGIALVLGLTGVLVNVTPARTAAGVDTVRSFTVPLGAGTVNMTVEPGRAGNNTIHIYLLDEVGRADDRADSFSLEFTQTAKGIGPISRKVVKAGPGHWQYDGDALSLPGQWRVTAVARSGEFDEDRADVTMKIDP